MHQAGPAQRRHLLLDGSLSSRKSALRRGGSKEAAALQWLNGGRALASRRLADQWPQQPEQRGAAQRRQLNAVSAMAGHLMHAQPRFACVD